MQTQSTDGHKQRYTGKEDKCELRMIWGKKVCNEPTIASSTPFYSLI